MILCQSETMKHPTHVVLFNENLLPCTIVGQIVCFFSTTVTNWMKCINEFCNVNSDKIRLWYGLLVLQIVFGSSQKSC